MSGIRFWGGWESVCVSEETEMRSAGSLISLLSSEQCLIAEWTIGLRMMRMLRLTCRQTETNSCYRGHTSTKKSWGLVRVSSFISLKFNSFNVFCLGGPYKCSSKLLCGMICYSVYVGLMWRILYRRQTLCQVVVVLSHVRQLTFPFIWNHFSIISPFALLVVLCYLFWL